MGEEHVRFVGQDIAKPGMSFLGTRRAADLHQCCVTERVALLPNQGRWNVDLISTI